MPSSSAARRLLLRLVALVQVVALPVLAADGDLDGDDFYAPGGSIGLVGAGIVADGGLAAPDGMAIAYYHQPDAKVTWHTFSGQLGLETACPFSLSLATAAEYTDAIFDAQGRLVLVGTATFPALGKMIFAVRYLYPTCERDDTFSDDGYFVFDLAEELVSPKVRRQTVHQLGFPLERLLIAATRSYSAGADRADTLILRLKANGDLDPDFDGDGWRSLDFAGETQLLADFVVDHENRIVFGANVDVFAADPDFVVGRLTPAGNLDPAFDGDGWRRLRFASSADDSLGAMEVAANDDILLAGTADVGAARHIGVVRLTETGGTNGVVIETAGSLSYVTSATLQGDRKLILAGWSNGYNGDFDIFALRVVVPASGAPFVDTAFGDGADADPLTYFELDLVDLGTDAAWSVDLAGGKPLLVGEQNFGDPQGLFVARLENAYIFVDGFEGGDTRAW